MTLTQILSKLKSLVYSKTETDNLLGNKAASSHTHTKSQITDFPTIPSKVSQLTNDSGFITGVSWDNVSGKPSTFTPSSHTHTKSQITDFPTIPSKTSQLTNDSGFLTAHQSLSDYSTKANTVKSLSISGKTITVTPGSGSAYTLTTQDTVYTHPTTAGNKHVPSGGSSGQFLGWDSAGTAKWVNNPNSDTKNTAGSTDTSSKIFLIGATSQAANPQTYSHDTAYVGTDGCLYSGGTKVLTSHQSLSAYVQKSGGNVMTGSLGPSTSGGASLGDSSHKWSTINGVAPGALGLPGSGVNITSLFNSSCQWTAYANGWVMALATYTGTDQIGAFFLKTSDMKISFGDESPTRYVAYASSYTTMAPRAIFLPVKNGQTVTAIIKAVTSSSSGPSTKYDKKPTMWFFPCVGNV